MRKIFALKVYDKRFDIDEEDRTELHYFQSAKDRYDFFNNEFLNDKELSDELEEEGFLELDDETDLHLYIIDVEGNIVEQSSGRSEWEELWERLITYISQ